MQRDVYFYCILYHRPPILLLSLNCQEASIFQSDIWILLPSPLNFSIIQYRARHREGVDEEEHGLVFWCVLTPSKVKYPNSFDVLPSDPPPVSVFLWEGDHVFTLVSGGVHTLHGDCGLLRPCVCVPLHTCVKICVQMRLPVPLDSISALTRIASALGDSTTLGAWMRKYS